MKKKRLFVLITQDPLQSGAVAEALRLCAGIAATEQFDLTVYLADKVVCAITQQDCNLINEDTLFSSLEILKDSRCKFLTLSQTNCYDGKLPVHFEKVDKSILAKFTVESDYLIKF